METAVGLNRSCSSTTRAASTSGYRRIGAWLDASIPFARASPSLSEPSVPMRRYASRHVEHASQKRLFFTETRKEKKKKMQRNFSLSF